MTLLRPIITEKSLALATQSQFTFVVDPRANAQLVAQAVRDHFKVTVLSVRMQNIKGAARMFRFRVGRTSDVKKAIVTLKKGQTIPGFSFDAKEEHAKGNGKHTHEQAKSAPVAESATEAKE